MGQSAKPTQQQLDRLHKLEKQFRLAIFTKDLSLAKTLAVDLQEILRLADRRTRIASLKNELFELAMDLGDFSLAEQGLNSNRKLVATTTKVYLEATALLAICYLRMLELDKAKPLISEVISKIRNIKTERIRVAFYEAIIERFDEEVSIYSLKVTGNENIDSSEIEEEVSKGQELDDQKIYIKLGRALPEATKVILFQIDGFAKKQLTTTELKLLPSGTQKADDLMAGKTIFKSIRRVIYNSICDPKSEIYKAWYKNGFSIPLTKVYLISAVSTALINFGIGVKALIVSAVALIVKFGLEVYCDFAKPASIMEIGKAKK